MPRFEHAIVLNRQAMRHRQAECAIKNHGDRQAKSGATLNGEALGSELGYLRYTPADPDSVAVLYTPGRYFACRQCGGLGYATQKEGAGDRASTKADKIRKRLGWEAGILNGNGGKPKGMHWTTYQRIKRHHDALVQVSFHDIGRKLGFLHRLLER